MSVSVAAAVSVWWALGVSGEGVPGRTVMVCVWEGGSEGREDTDPVSSRVPMVGREEGEG